MTEQVNTIVVCGAGTMGSGIAQVAATAGYHTVLYELNEAVLEKARSSMEKNLQSLVDKGRMDAAEKTAVQQRLQFTGDPNECIGDLIIEAIVEKIAAKQALLNQLAELNHSETIFATNTSSLSVSAIAAGIVHPERVVGMHFFNPAPLMKLVEVVRGQQTNEAVVQTVYALAQQMGKTPVLCKDAPGFIVNRVARHYYLEALRMAERGQSDYATIDALMEASGFKMGPFKLMDLIGNDVNYAVSQSVYEAFEQHPRFLPSFIQKERVEKGELGRKTGKGYYNYE
jgi:3-hydroxybutyryl-CoA dehydrogenase